MIALRPKSAQAMAMRARIVLSCGQGMCNSEIAHKLHITGARSFNRFFLACSLVLLAPPSSHDSTLPTLTVYASSARLSFSPQSKYQPCDQFEYDSAIAGIRKHR